jgi:hypothetical protein
MKRWSLLPKSKLEWVLCVVICGVLFWMFEFSFKPLDVKRYWICAQTGSLRSNERWFGSESEWVYEPSNLEAWMREHEVPIVHNWKSLGFEFRSVFLGLPAGIGSSADAPPMASLRREDLALFLKQSSEAEIRQLVIALGSDDPERQGEAVEEVRRRAKRDSE